MRINVGCGDHPQAGWVNVDIRNAPGVDVVGDVLALPFDSGSCDMVYMGHVLEHVAPDDVPWALLEVRRVLGVGGRVCVVGPDVVRAAENPEWHPLLPGIVTGGRRWLGDEHRWVASGPLTLGYMWPVFPRAVEVDVATLDVVWPVVDRVGWQFAIVAPNPREF